MEKRVLTSEEIEYLWGFVRKKYVDYYDVQVELVDHLASEIEHLLGQHQELTFEDALNQVYAAFGIFGFTEIVEQKVKSISRQGRIMWWKEFAHFFTGYELIFPVLIGLLIGTMLVRLGLAFLCYAQILFFSGALIALLRHFRRTQTKPVVSTLLASRSIGMVTGCAVAFLQVIIHVLIHLADRRLTGLFVEVIGVVSWGMVVSFVALLRAHYVISKEQRRLFPKAFA